MSDEPLLRKAESWERWEVGAEWESKQDAHDAGYEAAWSWVEALAAELREMRDQFAGDHDTQVGWTKRMLESADALLRRAEEAEHAD